MDTPPRVRLQAADMGAEAAEGAGRGNGGCPRDWIYQCLSQPIRGWR